jgi:hypothetical protein
MPSQNNAINVEAMESDQEAGSEMELREKSRTRWISTGPTSSSANATCVSEVKRYCNTLHPRSEGGPTGGAIPVSSHEYGKLIGAGFSNSRITISTVPSATRPSPASIVLLQNFPPVLYKLARGSKRETKIASLE